MRITESQLRRIIREEILENRISLTNPDGTRSPHGRLLGMIARYDPQGLNADFLNPSDKMMAEELKTMGYVERGLVGAGYVSYTITDLGRRELVNI